MSSAAPTTKRQTSSANVSAAPKPQCKIHASATVADRAQLIGPHLIEIGENTVIHPYAKIRADHGNVTIGRNCIVAEKVVLGPPSGGHADAGCILGDGVSLESGAVVEARRIGDYSTVEINARVRGGAVVGKWCKIGAMCELEELQVVEDHTVIFGDGKRRVDMTTKMREEVRELRVKSRDMELRLLRSLIPDGKVKWT